MFPVEIGEVNVGAPPPAAGCWREVDYFRSRYLLNPIRCLDPTSSVVWSGWFLQRIRLATTKARHIRIISIGIVHGT